MKLMSIDCEYNQPSRRTIEIGAAVFNAISGELVDTFHTYVNPGEPIYNIDPTHPYGLTNIVKLTGITDEMVKDAPDIATAFEQLRWFHARHKCFLNPLVWGSGVRNDSDNLYQESGSKEPNFMGFRVLDAKTIMQSRQIFQSQKIRGGLKASAEKLGLQFEGRAHTALADAINTFRVWHHLMKQFK